MNDLRYWLALHRIPNIGPIRFGKILERYPQLTELFQTPAPQLQQQGFTAELSHAIAQPSWAAVDRDLAWLAAGANHHIIRVTDPTYPNLLQSLPDRPPLLFIKGNIALLSAPQLAIVGSRNPTPLGKENAARFASGLTAAGLVVTSGLAAGIDTAAHRGALLANGKTLAVMGTSIERIYPKTQQALAEEIVENGALISEFPLGTPPCAENFPRRNRIVSGLAKGTLVVEATLRSGSLITARLANEQGRDVFAIPGSIHNALARGCHELIKQGAKLVESTEDILMELNPFLGALPVLQPATQSSPFVTGLDEPHQKLLKCIEYEPTSVELLIARSGIPVNELTSMLILLELEGLVICVPGGYVRALP